MKISVKEVLLESLHLYKKKFLPLAGVSLMITLIGLTLNFANYFYGQTFFHSDKIILLWSAIVFLVFIYFVLEPRLLIAPFILINAFFSEENMSIGEAYRKTRDKYWTALLYEIIPSAVAGFRVLFISYIYQTDISFYVKTIISYTSSICTSAVFFLLFVMIALEKTDHYLGRSFALIKRNLPTILLILIILSALKSIPNLTLPSLFTEAYERQGNIQALRLAYRIANFSVSTVVGILTYPIQIAAEVIVYRRLTIKEEEAVVA